MWYLAEMLKPGMFLALLFRFYSGSTTFQMVPIFCGLPSSLSVPRETSTNSRGGGAALWRRVCLAVGRRERASLRGL